MADDDVDAAKDAVRFAATFGPLDNLLNGYTLRSFAGKRRRGRQKKVWLDNIKDWTSLTVPQLLTAAQDRKTWLHLCCKVCLVPPTTSAGHGTRLRDVPENMASFVRMACRTATLSSLPG
ncbi:hypothetical protein Bbelb_099670 [Branchiostoma belcheri]|nr:hypothetical protein Bbelb_099670 [Branchiostoma belcheri]